MITHVKQRHSCTLGIHGNTVPRRNTKAFKDKRRGVPWCRGTATCAATCTCPAKRLLKMQSSRGGARHEHFTCRNPTRSPRGKTKFGRMDSCGQFVFGTATLIPHFLTPGLRVETGGSSHGKVDIGPGEPDRTRPNSQTHVKLAG